MRQSQRFLSRRREMEAELLYLKQQYRSIARIEGRLTRDEYATKKRLESEISRIENYLMRLGRK